MAKDAPPSIIPASVESVEERESGQIFSASQVTTNIPPCLGVVSVVSLPGIMDWDCGFKVWDMAEAFEADHAPRDIVAELFDLFSDVE